MAYPFTLYAMNSNTNDSLVAALVVRALLAIGSAPGRGVMAALAGFTKFAPFVLAPLFLRGVGERPRPRSIVAYVVAFAATVVVCMLPVLLNHDLHFFWRDSIQYQAQRASPFSIWGLWGGLGVEQHLAQGAVVACGLGVYFLPARRTLVQVAALAGALLIALQMTITYWLYPYLVWFFPMLLLAIFASHPDDRDVVGERWERLEPPTASRSRCGSPPPRTDVSGPGRGRLEHGLDRGRLQRLPVVISTPLSHGSSVEVSKRTGIFVAIASIACSRLTPITPPRGPVMPTSVM